MCRGSPASDGPPMSTSTPTKPISNESQSRQLGRSPLSADSAPVHSGIVAQTTAAPPDGTDSSAIATNPFPPTNSSAPEGSAPSQSRPLGHGAPRRLAIASSTAPATRNRKLPINRGGLSLI